VTH
ncbi:hypothetical protein ECEC1869_2400, partial [Escherichia coli EC1869]|jgi:hypothetical protein